MGDTNLADKVCGCCGERKPLADFPLQHKRGREAPKQYTYYRGHCRSCHAAIARRRRTLLPELHRKANRRKTLRRLGCDETTYQGLLRHQNGHCALCGNVQPDSRALAIDHDHQTNRIRGLLCTTCNLGMGYLEILLRKATPSQIVEYLQRGK